MHWTSNIFGPAATTIAGFGVLQNYPILNFKETLCQKKSGCGSGKGCKSS